MTGSDQAEHRGTVIRVQLGQIDPQDEYDELHHERQHDNEALETLVGDDDVAVTAAHTVPAARYLADGAAALAEAMTSPYSLRTTTDARAIINALRKQLDGVAGISAGLATWLDAAHQRGEAGDPARLVGDLRAAATAIRDLAGRFDADTVPADASPPLDRDNLTAGVTNHLRARGIRVDEPHIFDNQTSWEIPDGLVLLVTSSGWELFASDDGFGRELPAAPPLPYYTLAHPAQIADIVAATLSNNDPGDARDSDEGTG
ncbi:hypothetical protein [Phytohabitans rumicis]|uniref:Uncharacterized protein n=1 Tax=Phytohabitans rumicis TaxID=1076125 RepID=A0A6V8LEA9_9ACTN|nr:hypothetical protein [Phytohabitans rumicis]GFJ93141.1 hypothetical protein Prum_067830 [Phytohabitans rumicis]